MAHRVLRARDSREHVAVVAESPARIHDLDVRLNSASSSRAQGSARGRCVSTTTTHRNVGAGRAQRGDRVAGHRVRPRRSRDREDHDVDERPGGQHRRGRHRDLDPSRVRHEPVVVGLRLDCGERVRKRCVAAAELSACERSEVVRSRAPVLRAVEVGADGAGLEQRPVHHHAVGIEEYVPGTRCRLR